LKPLIINAEWQNGTERKYPHRLGRQRKILVDGNPDQFYSFPVKVKVRILDFQTNGNQVPGLVRIFP